MATYWVSLLMKLAVLAMAASNDLEPRVQNGQPLGPEHKHLVELKSKFIPFEAGKEVFSCTGSILNERWIITARHCLQRIGVTLVMAKVVRHMYNILPKPNEMIDYKLAPVVGPSTFTQHDIALMKVNDPFPLNTGVYQVIPMDINYPVQGSTGIVAGYGQPEPFLPRQGMVTNIRKCALASICSYSDEYAVRPDHGDSGGPLLVNGRLVGIISLGMPPTPGNPMYEELYAAIADHYKWIMDVIHT